MHQIIGSAYYISEIALLSVLQPIMECITTSYWNGVYCFITSNPQCNSQLCIHVIARSSSLAATAGYRLVMEHMDVIDIIIH